jgi:hypothetical protein
MESQGWPLYTGLTVLLKMCFPTFFDKPMNTKLFINSQKLVIRNLQFAKILPGLEDTNLLKCTNYLFGLINL